MRFQGANPENIDSLMYEFECELLELDINHRTNSNNIINLTTKLRNPSDELSNSQHMLYINNFVKQEIDRIIQYVNILVNENVDLHDICILFPQKKASIILKQRLENEHIDYVDITDFKMDSISYKYPDLIKSVEQYIENKNSGKSVRSVINQFINYYYSDDQNNIVLSLILAFSKKFDSGYYSSLKTWERLQIFYNYLQMEINWIEVVKAYTKNKLYLSTIHSSKGLEFDYIFMFGIIHYRLPHHTKCWPCQDFNNPKQVNVTEAHDLFYVGVSRAIKDVIFFFSRQDEQNMDKKNRKLSCVFEEVADCLKIIGPNDDEHYFEDEDIKDILCKPQMK